jgi:hypothetical protein
MITRATGPFGAIAQELLRTAGALSTKKQPEDEQRHAFLRECRKRPAAERKPDLTQHAWISPEYWSLQATAGHGHHTGSVQKIDHDRAERGGETFSVAQSHLALSQRHAATVQRLALADMPDLAAAGASLRDCGARQG